MQPHLSKARLLIEQSRYELAEEELRLVLTDDPEHPIAHSLLALSLVHQDRPKEAIQEIRTAIGLAPDVSSCYYAAAVVLKVLEHYDKALEMIQEAIRLEPDDAVYYSEQGSIYLIKRHWNDALVAAEKGLASNPEDVDCLNIRAMALVKLGRKHEAGESLETALSQEPDNARTHANQGWTYLHASKPEKAIASFREALRLEPTLDWARRGIVEALKAKNPIYRLFLAYLLWMSRLSGKARWGVILGLYFGMRILRGIAKTQPAYEPYLFPIAMLYLLFVYLSWSARPLFNLLLRVNRFGRLALSEEEIFASNLVGICLILAGGSGVVGAVWHVNACIGTAIISLLMVIPISGIFHSHSSKGRTMLITYTILLGITGLSLPILITLDIEFGKPLALIFLAGWFLYGFVANIIISREFA